MMFPFLLVAIDKCRYMERQESPQLKIILFSAQLQHKIPNEFCFRDAVECWSCKGPKLIRSLRQRGYRFVQDDGIMASFPAKLRPTARSAYRAVLRSARITFQGRFGSLPHRTTTPDWFLR